MIDEIKEVLEALLDSPHAKQLNNEYVYVRCPLCGDSIKHEDQAHCSIWIREGAPLIYHCWVCESSGVVDENFMRLMYINDSGILNKLSSYNRVTISKNTQRLKFLHSTATRDMVIPDIKGSDSTTLKKLYLFKRLGIEFNNDMIKKLKIVFSINDFLYANNLTVLNRFKKSVYFLDKNYIGFLSSTRDNINFRDITGSSNVRYIRYNLYENMPLKERMYIIPNRVNMMEKEINLHVAEGVFDILGIYFHIMNMNDDKNIYVAVGGSAYKRVIRYFLQKGFISNLNLNIYSDSDKNIYFYKKLFKEYSIFLKSIHLFYNDTKGEKDWGVPSNRINLKESVVLK